MSYDQGHSQYNSHVELGIYECLSDTLQNRVGVVVNKTCILIAQAPVLSFKRCLSKSLVFN